MDSLFLLAQRNGPDAVAVGFFGLWLVCVLVSIVLGILSLVLWVWALIDAIQNQTLTDNERMMWVLIIVFLHGLGGILYFIIGRRGSKFR